MDVQLHLHESGEVTASNYIVKNSVYGKCFLQYWANMRPPPTAESLHLLDRQYETLNFDNGDLMAAVMNLVSPVRFVSCMEYIGRLTDSDFSKFSNPYLQLHVECWKRMLIPNTHDVGQVGYANDPLRSDESVAGLRLYLPREGYWRTHARRGRFKAWWDELFGSCVSSDIIGHGWKAMPRVMWGASNHSCESYSSGSNGRNRICHWLTEEEELAVARKYCLWKSPLICKSAYVDGNKCIGHNYACTSEGSRYSSTHSLPPWPQHHDDKWAVNNDAVDSDVLGMMRTKWDDLQMFDVGNEQWWQQQLCTWC